MPTRPRRFGARPRKQQNQAHDQRRGSAPSRGYDRRWARESAKHRAEHPLCAYCALEGRITATALTDHLYPHRGDPELFWERRYWVSSCTPCHSGFKQSVERQGRRALDALARRLGLPPLEN